MTARRSSSTSIRRGCALLGFALLAVACSSPAPTKLSPRQRTSIAQVASAYDQAEAAVVDAFDATMVVPKLERWQETELRHQAALRRLRDALPDGDCRNSVVALLAVEDQQNEIRLRTIEDYRKQRFALVARDAVDYGASVVNRANAAEAAVATACGRSTTNPSITNERRAQLTPAVDAIFSDVLNAYAETGVAFNAAYSVTKLVADLETLQAADAEVATQLDEAIAALRPGDCRTALAKIRGLERTQAGLRTRMIAAGRAGDNQELLTVLAQYGRINSRSKPFVTARRSAVERCGAEV